MRSADARPLAPTGVALLGLSSAVSLGAVATLAVARHRELSQVGLPPASLEVVLLVTGVAGLLAGWRAGAQAASRIGDGRRRVALAVVHLALAALASTSAWVLTILSPRLGGDDTAVVGLAVAAVGSTALGLLTGPVQVLHLRVAGVGVAARARPIDRLVALGLLGSFAIGGVLLAETDRLDVVARRVALVELGLAALVAGTTLVARSSWPRVGRAALAVGAVVVAALGAITLATGTLSAGALPWSAAAGLLLALVGVAVAATALVPARSAAETTRTSVATRLATGIVIVLLAVLWRGLVQSSTPPAEVIAAGATTLVLAAATAVPRVRGRHASVEVVAAVVAGTAWLRAGGQQPAVWATVVLLATALLVVRWAPPDALRPRHLRSHLPAAVALVGSLWIVVPAWGPYRAVPPTIVGALVVLALAPAWRWGATDPTGRTRPLLVLVGVAAFAPLAVDRTAPFVHQARVITYAAFVVALCVAVIDARRATVAGAADPPARRDPRVVPPVLAVPGMLWLLVNVTVWSTGVASGDDVAYAAWAEEVRILPVRFATVDGVLALPSVLLALLYAGAALVVEGRRALPRLAASVAAVVAAGAACGALFAWGPL